MALYGPIWSCGKVEKLGKIRIIGKIGKLRNIGNLGNKMCLGKTGNLRDIVQMKRHVMCKKNNENKLGQRQSQTPFSSAY